MMPETAQNTGAVSHKKYKRSFIAQLRIKDEDEILDSPSSSVALGVTALAGVLKSRCHLNEFAV